jgi:magnesium-transporting ATPase (P-type)
VRTLGPVKTPLEQRVEVLSRYILAGVLSFGVVALIAGVLTGEDLIILFLTLIALAVAAVPEGLPIVMTIALSVAVHRMARRNAIIRHLPAIETLGSCTTIGCDKTGTLTRNEMSVQRIWAGGRLYRVEGVGYNPEGRLLKDEEPVDWRQSPSLEWTLRIGLLCNDSALVKEEGRWRAEGDPTEVALIVSAHRAGMDEALEKETHALSDILPFESERQYMATLNRHKDGSFLLVKGSPEVISSLSRRMSGNGRKAFEPDAMVGTAGRLAEKGLRVLAMAYRPMPADTEEITHEDVNDLTFAGLQAMLDPPRPEAIEAISQAKKSGVRVLMITGDNRLTAKTVARRLSIAGAGRTLTGHDLNRMDDEDLQRAVNRVSVFARVSPHHKLRIVNALKANDQIVALTGDGVNDSPALKAAHIGVAMGITGTDVAKESSDMVILDDNFASIYSAIVGGRVAFDNLRKVTWFLLCGSVGITLAVLISLFAAAPLIFLPAQILWVNLVTSGLQDVSLAFDPEEPGVAERPPRPPREGILNRSLILRLAVIGVTIGAIGFGLFYYYLAAGASLSHARTVALTGIVFSQFFNVFNARSEKRSVFTVNPLTNRLLVFSQITALAAHLSLIYAPPMQLLFRTTPLQLNDWLLIGALGSVVIVVSELHKLKLRRT